MPRRIPLPEELRGRAFAVGRGREAGLGDERMQGGDLRRPFHGVRIPAHQQTSLRALARAYRLRAPESHFFSHVTAARFWHIPLPAHLRRAGEPLDVAVFAPHAIPRSTGVRGHRLAPAGVTIVNRHGDRVTDAATTVCQLGTILDHDDLVAACDHLILDPAYPEPGEDRPYVAYIDLVERANRFRGPGAVAIRRALVDARQGAESRPETHLRLLIARNDLPEPALAVEILDEHGRFVARVDLCYREQRVVVEYDGEQHRTDSRQWDKDLMRLETIRALDWTVLSVRRTGLYSDPSGTVARIRAALAAREAK